MGVHSTFFGPIKYAILPQHLHDEEVLGGTGLVEAGTYIAILAGTILAGVIPVQAAAVCIILTAVVGWLAGRNVPAAPSLLERRSEAHTSELQSLMRLSYAVFCLKKKNNQNNTRNPKHSPGTQD